MDNRLLKAGLTIFGGFLTHLVMGAFYLWGNISIYATSYFRLHGYPDLKNTTMQAVFPFIYVGIVVGQFVGLACARKFGHKLFSAINMLVYGASLYLASVTNFYAFLIFMGFLPGLCIGCENFVPVDNAYYFYPDRKGVVGGLILCGIGFGAAVWNPLFQHLINPNGQSPVNGSYPEDIANKLPEVLRTTMYIYMGMGLAGVLMMVQTKKYREVENAFSLSQESLLTGNEQSQLVIAPNEVVEVYVRNIKEILQTPQVYLMWLQFYTCASFGLMAASQYKSFGLTKINDDNFFAIIGSVGAVANGLARFIWAALLDYVPADYLIPINSLMLIGLSSTFETIASSKPLFMIWIILIYLQYGGLFTFYPTLSSQIYGGKQGPNVWNLVGTAMVTANFTQFFLTKYCLDSLGYSGLFYIYTGFGLLSIIIHFCGLVYRKKKLKKVVVN